MTSPCIEARASPRAHGGRLRQEGAICEAHAQATVEAAFLLPTFLTLLLLAVQPVCLLYTRAVMESAAAETARLMITGEDEDGASYEAFALRRLAAVPDLSIFHEGGALAWDIELGLARDNDGQVIVAIEGTVSPLPVLGAFVAAFGDTDEQGDVVLHVEVSYEARPSWLEGDYDSWIGEWD